MTQSGHAQREKIEAIPLLVASPYLVTDFLGDHSITDVEIVQQSHLHFGADGERAILKAIARDSKRRRIRGRALRSARSDKK